MENVFPPRTFLSTYNLRVIWYATQKYFCSSPHPCSTSKAVQYTSLYKISMYSNNVNTFEMRCGLNSTDFVFHEYGSDIHNYHRLLTLTKHRVHCII
jgi:hypothetical protein